MDQAIKQLQSKLNFKHKWNKRNAESERKPGLNDDPKAATASVRATLVTGKRIARKLRLVGRRGGNKVKVGFTEIFCTNGRLV